MRSLNSIIFVLGTCLTACQITYGPGQIIELDVDKSVEEFQLRGYYKINDCLIAGAHAWDPLGVEFRSRLEVGNVGPLPIAHLPVHAGHFSDHAAEYDLVEGAVVLDESQLQTDNSGVWCIGIIAHELGHALGLEHVQSVQPAIMNAAISPNLFHLTPTDIKEFHRVHGD